MVRKCCVENCLSDSNRPQDQGVTFHKIPHHPDFRPKWISLCRVPEDRKVLYVCSRHFLRADFCSFKGTKYMLRQGVLPSVFPWDKSKLEALKAEAITKKEESVIEVKKEPVTTAKQTDDESSKKPEESSTITTTTTTTTTSVTEVITTKQEIKEEPTATIETIEAQEPSVISNSNSSINFSINARLEVLDNNNLWYPAKIIEVDYEENEVLIHFEKFSSKYDEWISTNSSRLRPLQPLYKFDVGDRCMACWNDGKKFPATVTKALENDSYEVLFDDGFIKTVKSHRMSKANIKEEMIEPQELVIKEPAPLFAPSKNTKQERRDKKRKLNVAALFRNTVPRYKAGPREKKRKVALSGSGPRVAAEGAFLDTSATDGSTEQKDNFFEWRPKFINGKPVGEPSEMESIDGIRKSVIVPDPRMPEGWKKHLVQKTTGPTAGKWDTVIVSPDGRRLRARSDVLQYLNAKPEWSHLDINLFDFSLYRKKRRDRGQQLSVQTKARSRKRGRKPTVDGQVSRLVKTSTTSASTLETGGTIEDLEVKQESLDVVEDPNITDETLQPALKIIFEDDAYKCPIEGCGKTFRRENLALMHVKHYHPEYTKFLDSTPNVADLAYARTVGENLDRSPGPSTGKVTSTPLGKGAGDKIGGSAQKLAKIDGSDIAMVSSPGSSTPKVQAKDIEIIKLLTQKSKDEVDIQSPRGLHQSYSNIFDRSDSDALKRDDIIGLKTMGGSRSQSGIKTLLPVVRASGPVQSTVTDNVLDESGGGQGRQGLKRKRGVTEIIEVVRGSKQQSSTFPLQSTDQPLLPSSTTTSITTNIPQTDIYLQTTPTTMSTPSSVDVDGAISGNTGTDVSVTMGDNLDQPIVEQFDGVIIEGGKIIKLERMKLEEIINCTCGYTEEDGLMIQCELCLCWQHAYCNNILNENDVPEKYVCNICQHPLRERNSMKYKHDQDWLKQGSLPTASFHSKDNDLQSKRFERLKKCFDISGGLLELKDYMHTLAVKLKIAENKNHPKLYLWAKSWEKHPLPEKSQLKTENDATIQPKLESDDHQYVKNDLASEEDKQDTHNTNMLMMILKGGKDDKLDLNTLMQNNLNQMAPIIPKPEAAIVNDDCRLNLLDHIAHAESLVEERLDDFEKQLDMLEEGMNNMESDMEYPKTRQTLQMLMRDLDTLKEFSEIPTI